MNPLMPKKEMKTTMTKIALALCMLALLSAPFKTSAQESSYLYADVNGDGVVDIADMIIVIDCILDSGNGGFLPNPNVDPRFISAVDYGAVGDGVTVDTQALESLFEAAFRFKKAVYLNPGTYLIRRSLPLKSGMEIYGSEATITKGKAVTTTLADAAVKGQSYIDVTDASGFNVGDQFFIADEEGDNWFTHAVINRIEGNRIHFKSIISEQQPAMWGCVKAHAAGSRVSTSFALLRSWTARYECDGVSVHDLTLDGNREVSEPTTWTNSCLCLDVYCPGGFTDPSGIEYRNVQRNLSARNLTIKNSPGDGICDLSEGGLYVNDCVVTNSAIHGIHLGQGFRHALLSGNKMTGNGSAGSGVFFSQEVTDVAMDNNEITSFEHGCGVDDSDACVKNALLRNNQFNDLTGDVFAFSTAQADAGGVLQISNNTIRGLAAMLFTGDNLDGVLMTGNEVKTVTSLPPSALRVVQCNNVILSSNKLPSSAAFSTPVISTGTTHIIQSSNSWN